MPIISVACPSCGRMNNVDSDSDVMICEFCGDTNDTREAIVQNYINCTKFAGSANSDSGNSSEAKTNGTSINSGNSLNFHNNNSEYLEKGKKNDFKKASKFSKFFRLCFALALSIK